MKILPILLTLSLIGAPAYANQGGEGGNTNCNGVGNANSPCSGGAGGGGGGNPNPPAGSPVTVSNTNRNTNRVSSRNTNSQRQSQSQGQAQTSINNVRSVATGGRGGQGGQGGQGGRSSSSAQGGASSSRSASQSASAARSGPSQSSLSFRDNSVVYGDERETPIAPLLSGSDDAVLDGVVVPLPTLGLSGFATRGDASYGDRDDYGVTLGFRAPLGAGGFKRAALRRDLFRATQEALVLRKQGILSQEAHPEHYAALYGPTVADEEPSTEDLPIRR